MSSKVNLQVIKEDMVLICFIKKDGFIYLDTPYFFRVVKNDGNIIRTIQLKVAESSLRCLKLTDDKSGLELTFNDKLESSIGFDCKYKSMFVTDGHYKYEVNDNLLKEVKMINRFKEFKVI